MDVAAGIPTEYLRKLDNCATEAIIIGYSRVSRGYKLWNPGARKVVVTRDLHFQECECSPLLQESSAEIEYSLGGSRNDRTSNHENDFSQMDDNVD